MGRIVHNLDVQHRGQATQTLSANARAIGGIHNFQTQLLDAALRAAGPEFVYVDRRHE